MTVRDYVASVLASVANGEACLTTSYSRASSIELPRIIRALATIRNSRSCPRYHLIIRHATRSSPPACPPQLLAPKLLRELQVIALRFGGRWLSAIRQRPAPMIVGGLQQNRDSRYVGEPDRVLLLVVDVRDQRGSGGQGVPVELEAPTEGRELRRYRMTCLAG
jgi:hypothetical protein